MSITRPKAKELCTAAEYGLVEASFAPAINAFTPGQLNTKITRARTLRDKYKDLARRQHLEAKGTRRPSGKKPASGNEGTLKKEQLFSETLARFEKRLSMLQERETKKATATKKADTQGLKWISKSKKAKVSGGKASKSMAATAKVGNPLSTSRQVRGKKVQSHVRASTQRSQAKRDTRK